MSEENIIMFPGMGNPGPSSLEDIRSRMNEIDEVFVESTTNQVLENVFESLDRAGYDLQGDIEKDVGLLQMALKSLLMKSKEKHHPFQDMARDLLDVSEDGYIYLKKPEEETPDEVWNS